MIGRPTDIRVEDYIEKSPTYAKEILLYFRNMVFKSSPSVTETIKWGVPHFMAYGEILCSIAAFKNHCSIGFRKAVLMSDSHQIFKDKTSIKSMGHISPIQSIGDMPSSEILMAYIQEALLLNQKKVKLPTRSFENVAIPLEIPDAFRVALDGNLSAKIIFEQSSPSFRKEYITWINEAKSEKTRTNRIEAAIVWIGAKKGRNWKYERK